MTHKYKVGDQVQKIRNPGILFGEISSLKADNGVYGLYRKTRLFTENYIELYEDPRKKLVSKIANTIIGFYGKFIDIGVTNDTNEYYVRQNGEVLKGTGYNAPNSAYFRNVDDLYEAISKYYSNDEDEMMPEKVKYMCFVEGKKAPSVHHNTLEKAETEAKRLAGMPSNVGKEVTIVSKVKSYKAEVTVNEVEL